MQNVFGSYVNWCYWTQATTAHPLAKQSQEPNGSKWTINYVTLINIHYPHSFSAKLTSHLFASSFQEITVDLHVSAADHSEMGGQSLKLCDEKKERKKQVCMNALKRLNPNTRVNVRTGVSAERARA